MLIAILLFSTISMIGTLTTTAFISYVCFKDTEKKKPLSKCTIVEMEAEIAKRKPTELKADLRTEAEDLQKICSGERKTDIHA